MEATGSRPRGKRTLHLRHLYAEHLADPRRERLFLSSLAFFVAFAATRGITTAIREGVGPFRNVAVGGTHVHHLVFGILLLLLAGYLTMFVANSGDPSQRWLARLTALGFGVGAALTLDEFALWLRLEDVYWTPQGKISVQAVLFFGSLLSAWFWGAPLIHAAVREARLILRQLLRAEHVCVDCLTHLDGWTHGHGESIEPQGPARA
jgi:hypothetical protein